MKNTPPSECECGNLLNPDNGKPWCTRNCGCFVNHKKPCSCPNNPHRYINKSIPPSAQTKKCFVCGLSLEPMVYSEKFGWFHRECSPCTAETKQESAQPNWEKEIDRDFQHIGLYALEAIKRKIHKILASERTRLLSLPSMKMSESEPIEPLETFVSRVARAKYQDELRQSILSEMEKGSV